MFAGYVTTSGENWRREYLAWPLVDFKDANLSIDCEMVPRQLREPIVAERVSLVADKITFPLKNEYERVNTTLEGIKDIASSREGREVLEIVDVDTPKPRLHYVSEGYLRYSEGTAGDGNICVDDDGHNVKLDKLGRRYRVRSDGVREVPTSRPLGIPPEAWARMSEREKEEAIRARDAIEKKSKARTVPKAAPKAAKVGDATEGDAPVESEEDEFEGYSPAYENNLARFHALVHSCSTDRRWAIRFTAARIDYIFVLSDRSKADYPPNKHKEESRGRKPCLSILS